MAVAHNPKGFTGTVDQIAEARRWSLATPPFRVASVTDWAVTADLGVARQVNIAIGEGLSYGVEDTTTASDAVAFAANNGATNRFDAVVATFAWVANSGLGLGAQTVTFRVIQGSTSPPAVNGTGIVDNTKINRIKGVQYDALLGIVRIRPSVGILSAGDVVDCRMWGGYEGYANVPTAANLTSLDTQPGSLVHAVDTDIVWNRLPGGVWGFEKWIGSDKAKQPMLAARAIATPIPQNSVTVVALASGLTDNSGGLFTISGDKKTITCQKYGRVRVELLASSDITSPGQSNVNLNYPAGGGNYLTALYDLRHRADVGYPAAGTLQQFLGPATIQVAPGDTFSISVLQYNTNLVAVNYDFNFAATYV